MTKAKRLFRASTLCAALLLLSACGGGSGGSSGSAPSAATYAVSIAAGNGGSISPSSATVNAGGTTTFTVTPNSDYVASSVTGCAGTLSGNTYTTAAINADCTVTASFSAVYVWIAGSKIPGASGVYGTLDVAAASNMPGARAYSVRWIDGNGNVWLFGGNGINGESNANLLNDLWEYSPSNGWWSWHGGASISNDTTGIYGTEGMPASTNVPGGRENAVNWIDLSGNLWLFGGRGQDSTMGSSANYLNDLWEYSPSSGEWTWVSGANIAGAKGIYGTRGMAAATNVPGARDGAVSWTDTAGNLWLFGGYGFDSTGAQGDLNDLWEYSPSTDEWTWVGGANTINATGIYGSKGVSAAANVPGARTAAASWTDAQGNFWLFGGGGYDSSGSGELNDLWEYSPASSEWTWVSGSDAVNQQADYGTEGVAAATNMPCARISATTWTDSHGNLWLSGGLGYPAGTWGGLDDLWEYSPTTGEWTWVNGYGTLNVQGVYGTEGAAAATNTPGARYGAVGWTDAHGNLLLFGGYSYIVSNGSSISAIQINDLWEYPTQ